MSKADMTNEPTWVYHLCCEHGGLLYVGIARDLQQRLKQHCATKDWWDEVWHVYATQYPDRMTARIVERQHIWEGRPRYNTNDVRPDTHRSPYRYLHVRVYNGDDWDLITDRPAIGEDAYRGADA